jgi:hypothetical protein
VSTTHQGQIQQRLQWLTWFLQLTNGNQTHFYLFNDVPSFCLADAIWLFAGHSGDDDLQSSEQLHQLHAHMPHVAIASFFTTISKLPVVIFIA